MSENPYELVRVTDPASKAHVTTTRARAERVGARILKQDAVNPRTGRPLPAKPNRPLTSSVGGSDQQAEPEETKENTQ